MLGYYDYTIILTLLSVSSGAVGLYHAACQRPVISILCLMLSGLLDAFDGTVARTKKDRTEEERKFGIQLDSLADLFCFGALPVTIGYAVGMHGWMIIIMVVYILAALIRLAYFNVTEEALCGKKRESYLGLPVTSVSLILPVIYSFRRLIGACFTYVYAAALLLIAIAFVSKFRIKKFGVKGILVLVAIGIIELLWLVLGRTYGII